MWTMEVTPEQKEKPINSRYNLRQSVRKQETIGQSLSVPNKSAKKRLPSPKSPTFNFSFNICIPSPTRPVSPDREICVALTTPVETDPSVINVTVTSPVQQLGNNSSGYSSNDSSVITKEISQLEEVSEVVQSVPSDQPTTSNALRKRSSSLSNLEQLLTDKVVDNSPPKVSQSVKKVKLPNFAAIHKKRFEKMESLDDYVQRRQERADNWAKVAKSIKKTLSIKKEISSGVKGTKENRKLKSTASRQLYTEPKTKEVGDSSVFVFSASTVTTSTAVRVVRQQGDFRNMYKTKVNKITGRNKTLNGTVNGSESGQHYRSNRRFDLLMKFRKQQMEK